LNELDRLGVGYQWRKYPAELDVWWTTDEMMESALAT